MIMVEEDSITDIVVDDNVGGFDHGFGTLKAELQRENEGDFVNYMHMEP